MDFTRSPLWVEANDAWCPGAPISPDDRRPADVGQKLRIATLNADYLFLSPDGPCGDRYTGCPWLDSAAADWHVEQIASLVRAIDADIVCIQEVHSCAELLAVNSYLEDLRYKFYLTKGRDTRTGQNVGLLTRLDPISNLVRTEARAAYPIPGSLEHHCRYKGAPGDHGVSKHFFATVAVRDVRVVILGLHLLARPNDPDRCAMREAQAVVLRAQLDLYLKAGYEAMVLGDFNDYDPDFVDVGGHAPTSRVLRTIREGTAHGSGILLHNVASMVAEGERYSDFYDMDHDCHVDGLRELSLLDHVLVTPGLRSAVTNVSIWHTYGQSCVNSSGYVSDHWPVVVDFDLGRLPAVPHLSLRSQPLPLVPVLQSTWGLDQAPGATPLASVLMAASVVLALTLSACGLLKGKRRQRSPLV